MADIKARLLEAIGGFKVPQHKKEGLNEFEITEGKDGKMNVRDTDVHARLDAIEQKLNGTLEMQLTGSNVERLAKGFKDTVSHSEVFELLAGSTVTVLEIDDPCELESLMIGANYPAVYLRVENRREDGSWDNGMRIVDTGGRYHNPISASQINGIGGENDYWKLVVYDDNNNRYAYGMKRKSTFGNGLRLRVTNNNAESYNVSISLLVTRYHKGVGYS